MTLVLHEQLRFRVEHQGGDRYMFFVLNGPMPLSPVTRGEVRDWLRECSLNCH
jgi:hypothetical protein